MKTEEMGNNMGFTKATRFSGISRYAVVLLAIALFATIGYGVLAKHPPPLKGKGEDLKCYHAIIDRMRLGEAYYEAAGYELRGRGYATASVFNWRLPTLAWLMALLPNDRVSKLMAVVLALASSLLWLNVLRRSNLSFPQTMFAMLLLQGPIIYSVSSDCFVAHEFWAGTLITFSLAAYGRGLVWLSVLSGLLALFLRELALPFVMVMLVLSIWEGHRREALAWFTGIMAFGVGFLVHWSLVIKLITESDRVMEGGWIVFGGWPFVLSTVQMHPYLLLPPLWVTALITPIVLLGLAGWRGALGLRIASTVGIYVVAFLVVGRPFNKYWGLVYTGTMLLGLMQAPRCFIDLWKSVFGTIRR